MVGLNSHLQNWSLMCLLLAYHASTWWVGVCIKKKQVHIVHVWSALISMLCTVLIENIIVSVYPWLKMALLFLQCIWLSLPSNGWFLVLQKLLLVCFCFVVWVLFSIFSIFCSRSFGDHNSPETQETTAHLLVKIFA